MYSVIFYTYSGMSIPVMTGDREDVKEYVRKRVKRARKQRDVTKVGRGKWEFESPIDAYAISDMDGFLVVKKH